MVGRFIASKVIGIASGGAQVLAKSSWITSTLLGLLGHFTYVSLMAVLIIAGTGVPIPEDIPLIISGYMCNEHESPIRYVQVDTDGDGIKDAVEDSGKRLPKVHWMILAGMAGVLIGDSMVFSIGRRGVESNNIIARHLRKVLHSERREKIERHFAKHGNLTVFAGRFMPGFRSPIFAFAGMSKMSYLRFLAIDGIAAGLSVPTFILLGYFGAPYLQKVLASVDRVKFYLMPVMIIVLLVGVIWYLRRRRLRRAGV